MEIFVSALLGYLLMGIALVLKDMGSPAFDRPVWAMRPTLGKMIIIAITWPTRVFIERGYSAGPRCRAIVFWAFDVLTQMAIMTALIWGAFALARLLFDNYILRLFLAVAIAFIATPIVLPLVALVITPIALILTWPLSLLFPPKREAQVNHMFCSRCGTENRSEAHFCHKCGNSLSENSKQPILSPQSQASRSADESKTLLGGSKHPWRRLFARIVDICMLNILAFFIVAFGVGVLFPSKAAAFAKALEDKIIANIFLIVLWIPLEAILLSTVGNTPAKWLFGISVKTTDGRNLSFQQALRRSFLAALQGMALGIPFIQFFTQIFAYRRLTKTGTTLWDTAANSVVTHKTWGVGRTIMCVVSVLFVLVLIVVMNMVGKYW